MSLKAFLTRELSQYLRVRSFLTHRCYATASDVAKPGEIDITSVDTDPKYDDTLKIDERTLRAMRDKSRLSNPHRNIIHGRRPYEKPGIARHHATLMFKRRMLGRFGLEGSGVPAGVAWPTKEAIKLAKEYERVAYPQTLQECWEILAEKKKSEAEQIRAREADIDAKLAKTAQWEKELRAKLAKKEAEIVAARERKERLVEEVRRHFGFKVDTRDARFKEMMEQKEKEDKKRRKAIKKKEKAEQFMAKLMAGNAAANKKETPEKEGSPDAENIDKGKTKPAADLA